MLTSIDRTALHIIGISTILDDLLRLWAPTSVGAALVAAVERGLGDAVATRLACCSDCAGGWAWGSFSFGGGGGRSHSEADAKHGETEEGKLHGEREVG